MAKRKPPEDQPTPEPEPTPDPEPTPGDVAPTPEAAPEPEAAPAEPAPEDRLKALEAAYHEAIRTIARQSIELDHAAENAEILGESREVVRRQKERWVEAKDEASAAKKGYEASLERHLELERELLTGQQRLPFPPPEAAAGSGYAAEPTVSVSGCSGPVTGATVAARPLPSVEATAAGDESWRPTPLGTLGIADELPHSILARLEDAGIVTVGDLSDFARPSAGGHCKRLVDIDGIGEAKAAKIEAALDAFWKRWSQWQAQKAAEASSPLPAPEDQIDVESGATDGGVTPAFDPPADYDPGADDDILGEGEGEPYVPDDDQDDDDQDDDDQDDEAGA